MRINQRQSGFTLIELLVVIAIIAVLSALLFTALANSRQKSNQAISANNLRQWGSALLRHLSEHNGELPSDGASGGANSDTTDIADVRAWFNVLAPHVDEKPLTDTSYTQNPPKTGQKRVWINPAVPKGEGDQYVQPPTKYLFCYAMNTYLSNATEPTQPIARIERPAATVFLGEQSKDVSACEPKNIRAYFGTGDPEKDLENSAHFLFCDGHVELLKRKIFDPEFAQKSGDNPSPTDEENLNSHFTFIPYVGAKP